MPTPILNNKSPYEVLFSKKSSYENLRVFGSLCYVYNKTHDKFSLRFTRCIFLEYSHGKKGFKVYDLDKRKIFVSKDVIFYESHFPFQPKPFVTSQEPIVKILNNFLYHHNKNIVAGRSSFPDNHSTKPCINYLTSI